MPARVTVLGSGSAGNATLLQIGAKGLLIDCGFGPRDLGDRLRGSSLGWQHIHAVLLTHTHGDHWNRFTLEQLRARKIPLIAHRAHHDQLAAFDEYTPLKAAGLTHDYGRDSFTLGGILKVQPIEVPHDSEPTFAFRIGPAEPGNTPWSYGHASDLGCVPEALRAALRGVDVLALEFNHCVNLERTSRRPRHLIHRVLSDFGHLSNDQAGAELAAWVEAGPSAFHTVIALHLSRECNRPELALAAAQAAAPRSTILAASQNFACPTVLIRQSA